MTCAFSTRERRAGILVYAYVSDGCVVAATDVPLYRSHERTNKEERGEIHKVLYVF